MDAQPGVSKLFQKGDALEEDVFNQLLRLGVRVDVSLANRLDERVLDALVVAIRERGNDGI